MSKHKKYVPKHAGAKRPLVPEASRTAARTGVVVSAFAVGATGVAVSGGLAGSSASAGADLVSSAPSITPLAAQVSDNGTPKVDSAQVRALRANRGEVVSRSADRRADTDPAKAAALSQQEGPAITRSEDVSQMDPRSIARSLLGEFGFSSDQFGCLDLLWNKESGWRVDADNPSSSAYGIPQALPGSKMSSAGSDWATNPATQIRWGLGYIADRYGSPCGAWSHSQSYNWY
ncbi:aggregation-promoting factor C-terminal-like domain-containing protein [Nocardioides acrostichi]|uniref:Lytic transglycosylase domain-containing protein n=1 Tax=Nocardioides acrostichi TaxID=2784339 RepID=A0A930V499_9ACTN|nr:lytic transglycosylase domain-containing protein [Nocardioides acrostichi]MBF4163576.1 lytic transglycosylase domain-containing protein [Nocardioides acrostichi]